MSYGHNQSNEIMETPHKSRIQHYAELAEGPWFWPQPLKPSPLRNALTFSPDANPEAHGNNNEAKAKAANQADRPDSPEDTTSISDLTSTPVVTSSSSDEEDSEDSGGGDQYYAPILDYILNCKFMLNMRYPVRRSARVRFARALYEKGLEMGYKQSEIDVLLLEAKEHFLGCTGREKDFVEGPEFGDEIDDFPDYEDLSEDDSGGEWDLDAIAKADWNVLAEALEKKKAMKVGREGKAEKKAEKKKKRKKSKESKTVTDLSKPEVPEDATITAAVEFEPTPIEATSSKKKSKRATMPNTDTDETNAPLKVAQAMVADEITHEAESGVVDESIFFAAKGSKSVAKERSKEANVTDPAAGLMGSVADERESAGNSKSKSKKKRKPRGPKGPKEKYEHTGHGKHEKQGKHPTQGPDDVDVKQQPAKHTSAPGRVPLAPIYLRHGMVEHTKLLQSDKKPKRKRSSTSVDQVGEHSSGVKSSENHREQSTALVGNHKRLKQDTSLLESSDNVKDWKKPKNKKHSKHEKRRDRALSHATGHTNFSKKTSVARDFSKPRIRRN
ncbi:hypothetical protein BJX99DRAFT_163111 [Aspergillus californicus]